MRMTNLGRSRSMSEGTKCLAPRVMKTSQLDLGESFKTAMCSLACHFFRVLKRFSEDASSSDKYVRESKPSKLPNKCGILLMHQSVQKACLGLSLFFRDVAWHGELRSFVLKDAPWCISKDRPKNTKPPRQWQRGSQNGYGNETMIIM